MARKINIDQCFEVMRKMPLEVSYTQVEFWVLNQQSSATNAPRKFRFNFLKILQQWFSNK